MCSLKQVLSLLKNNHTATNNLEMIERRGLRGMHQSVWEGEIEQILWVNWGRVGLGTGGIRQDGGGGGRAH